jgi:hypothetical protein
MAGENSKSKVIVSLVLVILLFFQSFPAMADNSSYYGGSIPLDQGAFLYLLTDLKQTRRIIDNLPIRGLASWQAVFVLDSTETAAAGLFNRATGKRFQLVGWGDYPSFTSSIALFLHRNWKWLRAQTGSYWFSDRDRLSVRIASGQINALAWREARSSPVPVTNRVEIPEGFNEFRRKSGELAPLSLWMENPYTMLDEMFTRERVRVSIPSDKLFLNLYIMGNNLYRAELRLRFSNEAQAWSISNLLTSNNVFPISEYSSVLGPLFFHEPPFVNDRYLDFQTALLTEEDIALLMRMFVSQWR